MERNACDWLLICLMPYFLSLPKFLSSFREVTPMQLYSTFWMYLFDFELSCPLLFKSDGALIRNLKGQTPKRFHSLTYWQVFSFPVNFFYGFYAIRYQDNSNQWWSFWIRTKQWRQQTTNFFAILKTSQQEATPSLPFFLGRGGTDACRLIKYTTSWLLSLFCGSPNLVLRSLVDEEIWVQDPPPHPPWTVFWCIFSHDTTGSPSSRLEKVRNL